MKTKKRVFSHAQKLKMAQEAYKIASERAKKLVEEANSAQNLATEALLILQARKGGYFGRKKMTQAMKSLLRSVEPMVQVKGLWKKVINLVTDDLVKGAAANLVQENRLFRELKFSDGRTACHPNR